MTDRKDYPPHGELADDEDQLSWDPEQHGRMRDFAAPDDAVVVTRAPREPVGDDGAELDDDEQDDEQDDVDDEVL